MCVYNVHLCKNMKFSFLSLPLVKTLYLGKFHHDLTTTEPWNHGLFQVKSWPNNPTFQVSDYSNLPIYIIILHRWEILWLLWESHRNITDKTVVPLADLKKSQACGRTGFLINRQKSFCRGAAWRIFFDWPCLNGHGHEIMGKWW